MAIPDVEIKSPPNHHPVRPGEEVELVVKKNGSSPHVRLMVRVCTKIDSVSVCDVLINNDDEINTASGKLRKVKFRVGGGRMSAVVLAWDRDDPSDQKTLRLCLRVIGRGNGYEA